MADTTATNVHQIAVLIDYENTGLDSIQWLFDQLSEAGRIIVKKAYGDWSVEGAKRDQLLELGIEPVQLFHSASGKNSSDIRLVIDAMDLVYQSPVDTFVIVSSDSDFAALVSKLRSSGKTVIGAGRKAAVSRTLVISCDKYYYLDQSIAEQTSDTKGSQSRSVLWRAVEASADSEGKVVGSRLHNTMQRLDPSFNYKEQGFSTFTKYLEASPEVKVSRTAGVDDVVVELEQADTGLKSKELRIDADWSDKIPKSGTFLPASFAAGEAARILGVAKLNDTPYKTLQGLLDASPFLASRWSRVRNRLVASTDPEIRS